MLEPNFYVHVGVFICLFVLIAECVHGGVVRRGGDEVQVMTKCILASHLSVCVIWRPREAEVLTEERQVLGAECVCVFVCVCAQP